MNTQVLNQVSEASLQQTVGDMLGTDVIYYATAAAPIGWGFTGQLIYAFDDFVRDVEVHVVMRAKDGSPVWVAVAEVNSITSTDNEKWIAGTVEEIEFDYFDTYVVP
jgi:hypothetical protein